jgi:3-oxoacyl-[acyl-carrier protein] reductase
VDIKNATALVTGAGRGIGRGIAQRLARDGAFVIVNYSRSAAEAASLVEEIKATGGDGYAVQGDISDLDQITAMFDLIRERTPQLDILVNNAGRGAPGLPTLLATTPEDFDFTFDLNTRGLFFVTQKAAALMPDGGRIINISSNSASTRQPGLSAYAGSKAAVEAFTRIWAAELAPRRITVNSVVPGIVDTDLIRGGMTPELIEKFGSMVPLGRMGQPADIADVVAFLAGDDSRWITGQCLSVSGGA